MITSKEAYDTMLRNYNDSVKDAKNRVQYYASLKLEELKKLEPLFDKAIDPDMRGHEYNTYDREVYSLSKAYSLSDVSFGQTEVVLSGTVPACTRGCCGYHHVYINMPIEAMFVEDKYSEDMDAIVAKEVEDLRDELMQKIAEKDLQIEEQRKADLLAQEEHDKEEFKRLSIKYSASS